MLRPQHALAGRQRALIKRLGLAIAALGVIEAAQKAPPKGSAYFPP